MGGRLGLPVRVRALTPTHHASGGSCSTSTPGLCRLAPLGARASCSRPGRCSTSLRPRPPLPERYGQYNPGINQLPCQLCADFYNTSSIENGPEGEKGSTSSAYCRLDFGYTPKAANTSASANASLADACLRGWYKVRRSCCEAVRACFNTVRLGGWGCGDACSPSCARG